MNLTIGKVEALNTAVVALGGLVIAFLLMTAINRLERDQALVGQESVYLVDMQRLKDTMRQWMLMGDLVFASGETYLVEGAASQANLAQGILDNLQTTPLGAGSAGELTALRNLLVANSEALYASTRLSHETEVAEASRLLASWDTKAEVAIRLLLKIEADMQARASAHRQALSASRVQTRQWGFIGVCVYLLLVIGMWLWVRAMLVKPLVALTREADRALANNSSMSIPERGPSEVRQLTRSAVAFLNDLEEKVRARTHALQARESALLQEVSERQHAERVAAEALQEAERASAAKSEFLANMSHEIRTPLNGVLGGTELALQLAKDPEQRSLLQTVMGSGRQLMGVINDVLDFSKLSAGQVVLAEDEFDLYDAFCDVGRMFAASAAETRLELVLDVAPDVPRMMIGDGQRFRQILSNLLNNAVKFTEEGEVVVRAQVESRDGSRAALYVAVEDTGVGIAKDKQSQIFEAFKQVDGTKSRKWDGTGLGLSICRQFVELMGGEIGLHSEPGSGSTFWFRVTLDVADEALVPRSLEGAGVVSLLVRNASLRESLALHLRSWGWQVETELSGSAHLVVIDSESVVAHAPALAVSAQIVIELNPVNAKDERVRRPKWKTLSRPVLPAELHQLIERLRKRDVTNDSTLQPEEMEVPSGTRVLVVEDNKTNQLIARKMLRALGCQVDVADHGAQGVEAVQQATYDLVLMDWHMPGMDGLEATRTIRAWERASEKPPLQIIALTANAMEGDERECLAAGMNGYLPKPVSLAALKGVLSAS